MWKLILLLTILSSNLIAGGDSELLTAAEMIAQAKEQISLDKVFQENIETLQTLKDQVRAAEKELFMDNDSSRAAQMEYHSISTLLSTFESFSGLDPRYLGLSEDNCERALDRIHLGFDPQAKIPRLAPIVKDLYNLIAKTCNLQQLD